MTDSSDQQEPHNESQDTPSGYFRRDVDHFHREANVLAGHEPSQVTSRPPENLRARRVLVFLVIVLAGLIVTAVAVGMMALPTCENPQYNWMPCVPDLR